MRQKAFWKDPGFWILAATNIYFIIYYYLHPAIFTTLLWLYWSQSVLIGFFNFLDILTVRSVKPEEITVNGKPTVTSRSMRVPEALFFMVHYGGFHAAYFVFLLTLKNSGPINWELLKYGFYAFLVGQIILFIQHKREQRTQPAKIATMFFKPYLRIIPMHLTIILPNFYHVTNMGVFLVLKAVTDLLMYIFTRPAPANRQGSATLLATEQNMNI